MSVKKICQNPIEEYKKYKKRIEENGMLASFPEFKPVIDYLNSYLCRKEILDYIYSKNLVKQYELLHMKIQSITLVFDISEDYPHKPPYDNPYPYHPTILVIQSILEFIDIIVYDLYKDLKPLYHTDRYIYHSYSIYNSEFIYFPTIEELSMKDFIDVRIAPIGFIGVVTEPIFADGYYNSPLDFWFHDINHTRRLQSYNNIDLCSINIWKNNSMKIKKCYEKIEDIDIRKLFICFVFEIVHEYAFTLSEHFFDVIMNHNIGDPSPFEHIVDDNFKNDIEKYRMNNGNIKSGYSFTKNNRIRYFFDKGPNVITSFKNKLINCFYDCRYSRNKDLPLIENRTDENIKKAVDIFIDLFNIKMRLDIDKLLILQDPLEKYPNENLIKPKMI